MNTKDLIKLIVALIAAWFIGFWLGKDTTKPEIVTRYETDTIINSQKIEELEDSILVKNEIISALEKRATQVKIKTVIEKERIKTLSITDNLATLNTNIVNYHGVSDSIDKPNIYLTTDNDTIISITGNNVIDINCAFTELDALMEIEKIQDSIIVNDSCIISFKNGIITEKDQIIDKQNILLTKESRKKVMWKVATVATAVIGGGLWLLK